MWPDIGFSPSTCLCGAPLCLLVLSGHLKNSVFALIGNLVQDEDKESIFADRCERQRNRNQLKLLSFSCCPIFRESGSAMFRFAFGSFCLAITSPLPRVMYIEALRVAFLFMVNDNYGKFKERIRVILS